MKSIRRLGLCALLVAAGCESGSSKATPGSAAGTPGSAGSAGAVDDRAPKHAGVWPDKFECDSLATVEVLGALLGGPAQRVGTVVSVSTGVPKPCAYEVAMPQPAVLPPDAQPRPPESWSYDLDCRNNYKDTADALFLQYADINGRRIEAYNEASDAGIPPNDAGIVYHQPGAAVVVDVGAKGLDHNDQSILFIDDDAPCYIRVNGPDAPRRLLLAKLVAKNLTYVNAPMELRPLK